MKSAHKPAGSGIRATTGHEARTWSRSFAALAPWKYVPGRDPEGDKTLDPSGILARLGLTKNVVARFTTVR